MNGKSLSMKFGKFALISAGVAADDDYMCMGRPTKNAIICVFCCCFGVQSTVKRMKSKFKIGHLAQWFIRVSASHQKLKAKLFFR